MLERALKVKSEIKRSEQEKSNKKRLRLTENLNDQQKNSTNIVENNKEAMICEYCGKNHYGPCLKKLGAYFSCGRIGYMVRDCPIKKKDSTKTFKLADQKQQENTRISALTQQGVSTSNQVVSGTILVTP